MNTISDLIESNTDSKKNIKIIIYTMNKNDYFKKIFKI